MAAQLQNVCNWPKKPDNLIFDAIQKNEIGRGFYGDVYSGKLDGRPVAVKKVHAVLLQAQENDRLLREFEKECDILKSLHHPNIVKLLGTYRDDGDGREPLLMMEVYEENLKEYLTRNKGKLSVSRQLEIAKEVTEGLCFLHRNNIVHRDLKLENILVGKDGHVRIGDFGQSKLLGDIGEDMKTTQPGTVRYMPPEALKGGTTYKANIDVFSLGVVFNCIATQCEPTARIMGIGHEVELKRRAKDLQAMAEHHPLELLIRVCLQDDPVIRPDVFMVHSNLKLLVCCSDDPELQRKFEENKQLLVKSEVQQDHLRMENAALQRDLEKREDSELKLIMQTEELKVERDGMGIENRRLQRELEERAGSELQLKKQTEELRRQQDYMRKENAALQDQQDRIRYVNECLKVDLVKHTGRLKAEQDRVEDELKKRKEIEQQLRMQTAEFTEEIQVRMDNEHQLMMQTAELTRKLKDIGKNKMEAERELKRQTEKLKEVLEEREMLKQQTASLQDENTKLQHALDHDPQSKLLHKLHEDIQVLRTGVKDISEEVRNVNKQICDPSSRSSKLENENMSLKFKQIEKDTELKHIKDQLAMTARWQFKRKEEDRSLIEQVIREQQMTTRKEVLSLLKLQSQTLLSTQEKDVVLDEEKLLGQVEDLQKQLKEKTEDLSKVSTELTEMSQKRDSMEKELKDALSVEREAVKDLQREVERLKLQTESSALKLTQSKECIKALENMLNNLVLQEKTTDVEQLWGDVDSVSVRKPIVPGPLAYETELEKFCWIPFGIQSLSVGQEGGLFPLQPQSRELSGDRDVIMLEVPENAVNTAVCDKLRIRYGVIVYGPFDVPEGYQLGSMAVYIYFDDDHTAKPVLLHLPHWACKDSESSLKCAIAPHRLEEGEEKYKFRFTEDGDFESTEGSCVITIDGHCSLFALMIKALQQKTSLQYYASRVEKVGDCGTALDVVITHASQVWLEILNEDKARGTIYPAVLFTFKEDKIEGSMSSQEGQGWKAALNEHDMVHQRDVEHQSHGIVDARDMLRAVKRRVYPPYISCQTAYSKEVRKTGVPIIVNLVIKGTKDRDNWSFPCTAYEYSSERQGPIGESISLATQSSVQPTLNGSPHTPTSPILNLNTLTEHVVRHVAADWYQLGLFLGVEARVLDTVKTNYSKDATEACTAVLGKWLDGAPGTGEKKKEWGTLLEAVGEAVGSEILKTIQKNLNLPSPVTCTQSLQDTELSNTPEVSQDTS